MKRILAAVLMCGAGSCIAADAATAKKAVPLSAAALKAQAAKKEKAAADLLASMAPADEYFGPLKLSIIGISNTIRDIGLRYKYNHDLATQCLASAQLSESAVRDWMKRYPHDPQLPRNVFFLQRLYSQILLQSSRDHASAIAKLLFADYGSSPQAKQLKKTLAVEKLPPLATPTPAADATVEPAAAPSPEAIPSAQVLPGASNAPLASPAPYGVSPYGGPTAIPSGSIVPVPNASPTVALPSATPNASTFATQRPGSRASAAPSPASAATQPPPTAPASTLPAPAPEVSATPASAATPSPASTAGASPAATASSR